MYIICDVNHVAYKFCFVNVPNVCYLSYPWVGGRRVQINLSNLSNLSSVFQQTLAMTLLGGPFTPIEIFNVVSHHQVLI